MGFIWLLQKEFKISRRILSLVAFCQLKTVQLRTLVHQLCFCNCVRAAMFITQAC